MVGTTSAKLELGTVFGGAATTSLRHDGIVTMLAVAPDDSAECLLRRADPCVGGMPSNGSALPTSARLSLHQESADASD